MIFLPIHLNYYFFLDILTIYKRRLIFLKDHCLRFWLFDIETMNKKT